MWTVRLVCKEDDISLIAGRFSTRYPESNTLPKRVEIAEDFRMYTKPSDGTHTFYFGYQGKEYIVRLIYQGESEAFTFNLKSNRIQPPFRIDYDYWKNNLYITEKIHKFIYKLYKS